MSISVFIRDNIDPRTFLSILVIVVLDGRTYPGTGRSWRFWVGGGPPRLPSVTASASRSYRHPLPHKSAPISFFGIDCGVRWRYRWGINRRIEYG